MARAIEISVSILIEKLKNLVSEKGTADTKLRRYVASSISKWKQLPKLLNQAEKKGSRGGGDNQQELIVQLLLHVYRVDNILDELLLSSFHH